jgi:GlpG protein
MMIIMASFTNVKHRGRIPLTFVCVAGLYLGQEVYRGLFVQNQVSEFGHIIGGVVGMVLIGIHGRLEARSGTPPSEN